MYSLRENEGKGRIAPKPYSPAKGGNKHISRKSQTQELSYTTSLLQVLTIFNKTKLAGSSDAVLMKRGGNARASC